MTSRKVFWFCAGLFHLVRQAVSQKVGYTRIPDQFGEVCLFAAQELLNFRLASLHNHVHKSALDPASGRIQHVPEHWGRCSALETFKPGRIVSGLNRCAIAAAALRKCRQERRSLAFSADHLHDGQLLEEPRYSPANERAARSCDWRSLLRDLSAFIVLNGQRSLVSSRSPHPSDEFPPVILDRFTYCVSGKPFVRLFSEIFRLRSGLRWAGHMVQHRIGPIT